MKIVVNIFLILFFLSLNGKEIDETFFLMTASEDFKLRNHGQITSYFKNAPSSTPYIDKIEIRTETKDFDPEQQRYSLRLYPKAFGETTWTGEVELTMRKLGDAEHETYYNEALKRRYELILSYLETEALLEVNGELLTLYEDRISILRKQSENGMNFNIKELIGADNTLLELQLEKVKLSDRETALRERIHIIAGKGDIKFDKKGVVTVSSIEKRIAKINLDGETKNIYLAEQNLKVVLEEKKFQLEKSKSNDFISFLKVEYDHDKFYDSQRAFSVGVGIKLPFINPDRVDINRKKVRYIKEKLRFEEKKRGYAEKIKTVAGSLKRFIKQYHILADRTKSGNAKISFKKYMKIEGIDPMTLLDIKESILRNELLEIKTTYTIRRRFVEFLDIAGLLVAKPFKNRILEEN